VVGLYHDRFIIKSPTSTVLDPYTFQWYEFVLGPSAQGQLHTAIGMFYLELGLLYGYDWIQYSDGVTERNKYHWSTHGLFEFGWGFFVSQRIHIRFFTRLVSPSENQWDEVSKDILGPSGNATTSAFLAAGLAVGYYFPEGREKLVSSLRGE